MLALHICLPVTTVCPRDTCQSCWHYMQCTSKVPPSLGSSAQLLWQIRLLLMPNSKVTMRNLPIIPKKNKSAKPIQLQLYTKEIYSLKQFKWKLGRASTSHHILPASKVSTSDPLYFLRHSLTKKVLLSNHQPSHPISSIWHPIASAVLRKMY